MHIDIEIPRPYLTLAVLVGVVWTGSSFLSAEPSKVLGQVQPPEKTDTEEALAEADATGLMKPELRAKLEALLKQ